MLTITDSAQQRITEILQEEKEPGVHIRMFVAGGGCSGFQYGFELTKEKNEDDWEIPALSASVLVDAISMQYLENAVVDFKSDLDGARFSISNPQAQTTCGCGSSFSPY
jgi:iron-sulfur cluster insertion protein